MAIKEDRSKNYNVGDVVAFIYNKTRIRGTFWLTGYGAGRLVRVNKYTFTLRNSYGNFRIRVNDIVPKDEIANIPEIKMPAVFC